MRCYLDGAHRPHSWTDGPDEREWCSGADEPPLTAEELESYEAAEDAEDLFARGAYDYQVEP